jgi:hypothetical protein
MLIGINAIIHIIMSQRMAIGVLTMIAIAYSTGLKRNPEEGERFSRYLVRSPTGTGSDRS